MVCLVHIDVEYFGMYIDLSISTGIYNNFSIKREGAALIGCRFLSSQLWTLKEMCEESRVTSGLVMSRAVLRK